MRLAPLLVLFCACGSGSSEVTIDMMGFRDPVCLPSSSPPPGCVGMFPGGKVVRQGWQHAQLGTLRDQAATVELLVHSDAPNLGRVATWILVTNGVRHTLAVASAQAKGGMSDVSFMVDTAWLDDRKAALDTDADCADWCKDEVADASTIDELALEAWGKDSKGNVVLYATHYTSTIDRRGPQTTSAADGKCSHACEPCPYGSSYTASCTCYFCTTYCALYNSFGQYMGTFITGNCC